MTTITINNQTYSLPSEWNELTPEQLRIVVALRYKPDLSPEAYLVECFLYFLHFQGNHDILSEYHRLNTLLADAKRLKTSIENRILDFISQIIIASQSLAFVAETSRLTKCPYPTFGRWLFCLQDGMRDMSYIDYAFVETNLKIYLESEEESDLNEVIVALYAFKDKDGNRMVKTPNSQNKIRKAIATMPIQRKLELLVWVEGCLNDIQEQFPSVFSGDGGGDSPHGHASIILELSGDKFGTVSQTENNDLFTILIYIEKQIKEYEKIKQMNR